jgi:hypothetical protein
MLDIRHCGNDLSPSILKGGESITGAELVSMEHGEFELSDC